MYANELDLIKKVSILNNIKKTHPEWIDKVNIPLQNHALLGNSYYSISIYSINNNSYNEYFNQVSEISYYRILSKIILNKITNEKDLNIINDFITNKKSGNQSVCPKEESMAFLPSSALGGDYVGNAIVGFGS